MIVAPRYPEASGGSRYVENLGLALTDRGVDVSVVSINPGAEEPQLPTSVVIMREHLHRNPVIRGPKSIWVRLGSIPRFVFKRWDRHRYRKRFRRGMEACGSDTVVIFTHATAKLCLDETGFVAPSSEAVLIGQHHSAFESIDLEPGLRGMISHAFRDVHAFTALSPEDASRFATLLTVPCFSVDNMSSIAPTPSADMADRSPSAIALVRLSHEKRVDVMIRAFAQATSAPTLCDWRLKIYGDGELREELEQLIDSLDAGDRIELCGVTDNPLGRLAQASINLLTSEYEGFGYSVLEAAQTATPSLAFDCSPGLRHLMHNVHGRLVPPESGEAGYTSALRELLSSPERLATIGERAREGAVIYEPSRVLSEWARMLRQLSAHS